MPFQSRLKPKDRARPRRPGGFTMAEVIIAASILAVIFGLGAVHLKQMTYFLRMNIVRLELQREARAAMKHIQDGLRQGLAGSVNIAFGGKEITYDRRTRDGGSQTVHYFLSGTEFKTEVVGSPSITLARDVASVQFFYPNTADPYVISVTLRFEKDVYGAPRTLQLATESIRMMNWD